MLAPAVDLSVHHRPRGVSDRIAFGFVKALRLFYLVSPKTAHRVVGYLAEIDAGRSEDVAAPAIARAYWNLQADATLRDVVEVVRADEAHHRDVNHGFANELAGLAEPVRIPAVWPHQPLEPHWRDAA